MSESRRKRKTAREKSRSIEKNKTSGSRRYSSLCANDSSIASWHHKNVTSQWQEEVAKNDGACEWNLIVEFEYQENAWK